MNEFTAVTYNSIPNTCCTRYVRITKSRISTKNLFLENSKALSSRLFREVQNTGCIENISKPLKSYQEILKRNNMVLYTDLMREKLERDQLGIEKFYVLKELQLGYSMIPLASVILSLFLLEIFHVDDSLEFFGFVNYSCPKTLNYAYNFTTSSNDVV
ncbi:hypothetical protein KSF78_0005562 [Schistosoma japonicum]|nr:hypothetical protein KSF78_0005562 [Schistosoma japonicum]